MKHESKNSVGPREQRAANSDQEPVEPGSLHPIGSEDVDWLKAPEIGFWEATFLPAIAQGLKTTIGHVINYKPVTQQFPEQKPDLPPTYRGVHRLNRDEQGRVKCVACFLCATACPAHCIEIVAAPSPWSDRDKIPETFVIDELKCIGCGMCEEACPVDAIEMTSLYDIFGLSRQEMLFDKEKLLSVYDETIKFEDDPVRTTRGRLGPASEVMSAPLNEPTPIANPVPPPVPESPPLQQH
jgi:NADH-quinone oxidoreductase subunit I